MSIDAYRLTFLNPLTDDAAVRANIGIAAHVSGPIMELHVPPDGASVGVLPDVSRTLTWVRLTNRFPVRVRLKKRDPDRPFRMATTAVVTIRAFSGRAAPAACATPSH